jgi:hypothetical protein
MKPLILMFLAACTSVAGDPDEPGPDEPGPEEHDARFVGLWAVEQPTHALYEVTYYDFAADGALAAVSSDPASCGGHLSQHCVTGSVANCVPRVPGERCEAALTCVFGDRWSSRSSSVLVIAGACSDGVARDIAIELAADSSSNTGWGGAGGTLLSVGGETSWSHDNWPWAFRKCPAGTDPATCVPSR